MSKLFNIFKSKDKKKKLFATLLENSNAIYKVK